MGMTISVPTSQKRRVRPGGLTSSLGCGAGERQSRESHPASWLHIHAPAVAGCHAEGNRNARPGQLRRTEERQVQQRTNVSIAVISHPLSGSQGTWSQRG